MAFLRCIAVLACFIFFFGCSSVTDTVKTEAGAGEVKTSEPKMPQKFDPLTESFRMLTQKKFSFQEQLQGRIDSLRMDSVANTIYVYFDERFSENSYREKTVESVEQELITFFEEYYKGVTVKVYAKKLPLQKLIPNYFLEKSFRDPSKQATSSNLLQYPIVNRVSSPSNPVQGLAGRNILLWHSHGWYYSNISRRWEWQRPRLFQIVEDKLPMSFTLPYLIPMLENAGANVFVPRERDIQVYEVILDNDTPAKQLNGRIEFSASKNKMTKQAPGFSLPAAIIHDNLNPFKTGTYLRVEGDLSGNEWIDYIPDIPETGEYSVTISYHHAPDNSPNANYSVFHSGGESKFEINQTAGGSTWIYLGTFKFEKGIHPLTGKVRVSNKCPRNAKFITTDAVRFGGGMGIIARDSVLSNRPKYLEGSRYWMQFAGMPDTLTYSLNKGKNDYNDDYQSRSEYGNYLYGNPFGPSVKSDDPGLGVPVHFSLAFHTDAGISKTDTVIGTLAIYSSTDYDSLTVYPDSVSRMANRDAADLMQSQIVEDIEKSFSTYWNRRQLRDSRYSESVRPNFPAVLLELLSHQSFPDMKAGVDPRFKFVVSRAIYKSILRFLSSYYGFDYTVQPLPVDHLQLKIGNDDSMTLTWEPVLDRLEASATPESYIVYTRIDSSGFDNGRPVSGKSFTLEKPKQGHIYSFKVTAVNKGGESFPSEILSAGISPKKRKPALIVNAFDRVCGPAYFQSEQYGGFLNQVDEGVPDRYQLDISGPQYDFDFNSEYVSNDAPGHGASSASLETQIIAGNTRDFVYTHGEALLQNGISFASVSDETFSDASFNTNSYELIDIIAGEELITVGIGTNASANKEFTLFTPAFRGKIDKFLAQNGKLFISGSHIGKELFTSAPDTTWRDFGMNTLKLRGTSPKASADGKVFVSSANFALNENEITFNTEFDKNIYKVESPEGFTPGAKSEVLLRYRENSFGAVIGYRNDCSLIVMGFPFETVKGRNSRIHLMKAVVDYLNY